MRACVRAGVRAGVRACVRVSGTDRRGYTSTDDS